jgi:hypothetical protein
MTKVHVIEVLKDEKLKAKEARATLALRSFFPHAGPVRLYRTKDGRFGFQVDLTLGPGDRERFDKAYTSIMRILGEKRGRPRGVKTVQTKLLLPEPTYRALKKEAAASGSTMSSIVDRITRESLHLAG